MLINYIKYKKFDKVIIFGDEYTIEGFPGGYYLLSRNKYNNTAIKLGGYDNSSFMRKVGIRYGMGTFPEHETLEDLSKSIFYLKRLNLCVKK